MPHVKFASPRVPENVIRRPLLRDRLEEAVSATDVTLVCAPAGYGKTLLLADWIDASKSSDKAWVSLDSDDKYVERFFSAVLHSICACEIVPPDSRLRDLVPPRDADNAGFLAELVNAIEALPERLHLVLDNMQDVLSDEILHCVATLIRHQPRNLRLVLSSRSDPPLPLARLRVQGRLTEIRAGRLGFSLDEAADLLRAAGVALTEDQLSRLVAQTDGWVAGLRLAARSLRDSGNPERFLADCASNDRAIADFLVGEVLARLPAETRELLELISICEEVTPQLAALLSGRDDAGAVLADLERESALVSGVGDDRRWYRVRPLLRCYLQADLQRQRPDLIGALHGLAGEWFAGEGRPLEALQHAEQTGNERAAVAFLRGHALDLLLSGEPDLVRRGVAAAGARAVDRDPWLRLFSALANLELGEFAAAESDLARCAKVWPDLAEPALVSFRQLVLSAHALACGRRPVPQPRSADDLEAGGALGVEAWTRLDRGLALIDAGDRAAARHELSAADQLAREQGLDYLVMHGLTALAVGSALDGDYPTMEAGCAEALAIADRGSWQLSPWLSASQAMLGLARLMHLDPGGAVEISSPVAAAEQPAVRFMAALVAGTARFDQGQRVAGLRLLGSARRDLGGATVPRQLAAIAAVIEHHCAMVLAEYPLAREVAEWATAHSGITAESHLMAARTAFARGEGAATERALREALADASPHQVPMTQIECRLLEAAVSIHAGRRTQARSALSAALSLAGPGAVIRPFAHADRAVRALLLDQIGGFGDSDAFACRVRRVLAEVDGGSGNGVLTEREHAVLARLTSPQPLDEVASDLLVSVNTVKTHVRAIYAKLGVNNRRAAVVAARELGLT